MPIIASKATPEHCSNWWNYFVATPACAERGFYEWQEMAQFKKPPAPTPHLAVLTEDQLRGREPISIDEVIAGSKAWQNQEYVDFFRSQPYVDESGFFADGEFPWMWVAILGVGLILVLKR
jgi:hypothetical protein